MSEDPQVEDDITVEEIRDHVQRLLLPFLTKFASPQDVVAYLSEATDAIEAFVFPRSAAQRHAYASIICSRQGDEAKARLEIELATQEAVGSPIEDVIKRVREHLRVD